MKQLVFPVLVFSIFVVSFSACGPGSENPKLKAKPNAYSKLNELTIVADTAIWNGPAGDTFRYYFESPYLILPQPEPMFDLRYFTPRQIAEEQLYRSYRTYIFLSDLSRSGSKTNELVKSDIGEEKIRNGLTEGGGNIAVGQNKWANNQQLFYLYGSDENQLADVISKAYPAVKKKIQDTDADRIQATVFQGGNNSSISNRILEAFGAQVKIPKDYKIAIDDGNVMWLRKENKDISSNILVTKVKYSGPAQMSKESLKELRNELGKKYVSSTIEGSYMTTNDVDLPMFAENKTINNRFTVELHGIWELENDFMGGPFVSLAMVNEKKGEMFFIDGFIFSPGEEKRNSMQYMEAILRSVKF